ncbi:MAG: cytochrome-c oxidase, cbb3-type subunit II [Myxococcales bacterium]|nr:cytochrome-c oxidase, cbb3-type subunit II [Myxococcales bacterium]MCB9533754.1 cytochrome-c oxidase, cbb3-type subunit II [Myxococcales bacterium]
MSNENDQWHSRVLETNIGFFGGLTAIAILIGGLVEIVPMYTVSANQPENAELVAPYTPLQLAGRDIYVREGCYNCHSQMVRPMRAETMRYGEWSRAAEYVHDRPFQLGSRRIGPDLQRVGGKYPDGWHYEHMRDPRSTSPGSVMPPYPWLLTATIEPDDVAATMRALDRVGESYSDADITNVAQLLNAEGSAIVAHLSDAGITASADTEIVALIAYLQRLGTDADVAIHGAAALTPEAP